jgi:nucleotide-binding universal stress UspA family protein
MISNIRHILFPVDFSERCAAIQPLVKAMAHRFNAKVTLFHALQIPATFYPAMETSYVMELDLTEMQDEAEEKLASFYAIPRHPLPESVDIVVATADPAHAIVDYAEAQHVDLIMLPTHGYGRYRGLLLGSIAAKVLHDARCPVWTAAHTQDPILLSHASFQSMMVAIDLNEGCKDLLQKSLEFAAYCGAKLRIIHAVAGADPDPDPYPQAIPNPDFRHFLMQAALEEVAQLQREAGTGLEVCMESGNVSKVVQTAAERHNADLVLIGRGKLSLTFGRLRTHAYSIIRDSPCPVLSL